LNPLAGDLRRLLKDTVDFFKVELASRQAATDVELVLPSGPVRCCFDGEQLSRALINLLQNAQQAVDDGGRIRVALDKGEGCYRIVVSDNGEGVPGNLREKIFTPFFTTREGGTGLGLALVKKIAEAHRGNLHLQSGEAAGSEFVIEIPEGL
jgi:signal transduction histidine kinase